MVHGPVHRPFDAVQLSCPLSRKTPSKHVSTLHVWRWGWCSWGHRQHSSSSKHGELSWCQRAGFLVSSNHNIFTQFSSESFRCSLANFRRPGHVLSWAGGPCGHCRILVFQGVVCYQFSWWLWSRGCLEIIDLIFSCSSGPIPHRSHDHWISTRVRTCMKPQSEDDWQFFCVSSICE